MIERKAPMSPQSTARLAGVFQALEGFTSSYGQVFILNKLIVASNPTATAVNFLGHEKLLWYGFALSVAGVAFHLLWAALFYGLFKIINKTVARIAAFVIIVCCAIQAVTALLYITPLLILKSSNILSGFTTVQVESLAYLFLRINGYAFNLNLVFFGLWCSLTGYLMFRSTFIPRILGVLLFIDGVGWMLYCVPPFAARMFPVIAAASGIAEIPLQLWLIIKGVNSQRWYEQAGTIPRE